MLDQLPLLRLRFDLETLEAADVPPYKGDMLRMALLWWLSEYWCTMPNRCRRGCRAPQVCMFGRLCEPPVNPEWPARLRRLMGETPPPAYVLWDGDDRRHHLPASARWRFELTLIGALAVDQLPYVVAAIQQGAETGMGRVRLRSRVLAVTALAGTETIRLAALGSHNGEEVLIWQQFSMDQARMTYAEAAAWAQRQVVPARSVSLRYLSPTKIKERGAWVDVPAFAPVMKALVRRLRLLSVVHGAGEWPHAEWGPLLDLAETVRLEHEETFKASYERYSKSSGRQEVGGFAGQAWYTGDDLGPLLPMLWLGQWLQVGKNYVLGNGRYLIEHVI